MILFDVLIGFLLSLVIMGVVFVAPMQLAIYGFSNFLFFDAMIFFVAAGFGFLFYKKRKLAILVTAVSWFLYTLYEIEMYREGAILRVDIFLVWPILFIVTLVGIVFALRSNRR